MFSRLWRAVAAIGTAGVAATCLLGVDTAAAHQNEPHTSDEQHAAEDRAGVSVREIEKQTRANALRIEKATGVAPGGRTSTQRVGNERASIRVAADPGQGGEWSDVVNTPVVPVFQAVLPNGKVLLWDSVGDNSVDTYPEHKFTRAVVWDPANNTSRQVNVSGYNIFCAGYAHLANGNVLVAGGNKGPAMEGIVQTHIFDWRTESWSRGPNMNSERWYPSVAALGNGEALIVGGGPTTAEVYQTNATLRRLTGFTGFGRRVYPFLVPRPNGQVELVGPYDRMDTMKTTGTGSLTATRKRDGIDRIAGSFATYDIGKVLVAGGGSVTEGGQTSVPTRTASVVDVSNPGTAVRSTNPMSVGRRQFNLTVLADGSVLATGGQSKSTNALVDLNNPVFAAERWNPATGTWTVLASASRVRQYHSVAALLPDGRVMTGGGGICGTCTNQGYLEKNIEYFTPPYLYKKDGSGELADRPVIDSAPDAGGYAETVEVRTDEASSIDKVGLVRLGAPTHGDDQGQRYVPLTFSASGSTLSVRTPATANIAPPGYYMLFVTDDQGVPSKAKIIKLDSNGNPRNAAPGHDYNGDGKADLAVWRPSTGQWLIRGGATTTWGVSGDKPVPGDFDGDGRTDLAVWRPSTGKWYVKDKPIITWGQPKDQPVQADYNGDGKADMAVWRPSTGTWYIRGQAGVVHGRAGDIPVPADYDGDGAAELAVWRPSTGRWYVRGMSSATWGVSTDKPVPADYTGDGAAEFAVWRPSGGRWYVKGMSATTYGVAADKPVPADYYGDGTTDLAVWRPSTGQWYIRGSAAVVHGRNGDVPV